MKTVINPSDGPQAVGPYSPGIRANGLLFLSGQIPLEPETGEVVRGSIEVQTRKVLENIGILLANGGSDYDRVVRVGVYLSDLSHFEAMNQVYGEFFGDSKPARTTVEVARLPKDVQIEIDLIALA